MHKLLVLWTFSRFGESGFGESGRRQKICSWVFTV